MQKVWENLKGVILIVLVFVVMINLYTERIKELRIIEEQTNTAYYEN